jgi:hypothetical protein
MDIIMQEYRSMPAGSPDFSLGSRRDFTPMAGGGTYNDRGNLGNMGLRQSMAAQAPTGTSPINPTFNRPMPDDVGMQYRPSMAPQSARPMIDEVGMQYRPSMNPALAPRTPDEVGFQYRPSMNPLAVPGANTPVVAGLDTANRPAPMASSVTAPARQQGFFEQLFKGPQFQSNNMPVNAMPQGPMPGTGATMPSYINYGDPNNAADFFRADALLQQQNPGFFGLLGGGNG